MEKITTLWLFFWIRNKVAITKKTRTVKREKKEPAWVRRIQGGKVLLG